VGGGWASPQQAGAGAGPALSRRGGGAQGAARCPGIGPLDLRKVGTWFGRVSIMRERSWKAGERVQLGWMRVQILGVPGGGEAGRQLPPGCRRARVGPCAARACMMFRGSM
jgi:hypothetical protein